MWLCLGTTKGPDHDLLKDIPAQPTMGGSNIFTQGPTGIVSNRKRGEDHREKQLVFKKC